MRCYFAHPVTDYGNTERQQAAINAIEARGWKVESPDKPWHQQGYDSFGMSYFTDIVAECDALAFLRFPSGCIGAGVGREIETALTRGLHVWDIANNFALVTMMPPELLTVEETRAQIVELKKTAHPTPELPGAALRLAGGRSVQMTSHQDLPDQCNCEICHARRIGDEPQLDDATMISWWENQCGLLIAENERLRDAFRQVVTDRVVEAGAQSLCPDAWRKDSQGRYELDEPARDDMRAIAREVIAAALQAHSLMGDQGGTAT